jgi:hypothetical protein
MARDGSDFLPVAAAFPEKAMVAEDDPFRLVILAVRTARIFGTMCLLFSLCTLAALPDMTARARGRSFVIFVFLVVTLLMYYPLPGILYLIFAWPLRRGKSWAAVVLLVITGLHAALLILSLIGLAVRGGEERIGPLMITGFMLLFQAVLIYYTIRAMIAIRHNREILVSGFEPIMSPIVSPWQQRTQPPPASDPENGSA